MNIQRFLAPTSREALAKARSVFGEGTLILSNRATAQGVQHAEVFVDPQGLSQERCKRLDAPAWLAGRVRR